MLDFATVLASGEQAGGTGDADDTQYEDIRYQAYGRGGAALMLDGMTDTRNRHCHRVARAGDA